MKNKLFLFVLFLAVGCNDRIQGKYQVYYENTGCTTVKDNSEKRRVFFLECRDRGSWSMTCSDLARINFPDQVSCTGSVKLIKEWHYNASEWSVALACEKVQDPELKRLCESTP